MSQLTSHILDTSLGRPAAGVNVELFAKTDSGWQFLASAITNSDGRITSFDAPNLPNGIYRLKFLTSKYYDQQGVTTFYPFVEVAFHIRDAAHYHVPLLLNPFGYSTYRGS